MSTERRALIAFALSMLLFLAYDALYLSPKVKRQQARRRVELMTQREAMRADSIAAAERGPSEGAGETPEAGDTGTGDVAAGGQGEASLVPYDDRAREETAAEEPPAPPAESRLVTVVSDLYEITLSTRGGEITSVRLLNYLTLGEPVELFPQNPGWTYDRVLNVTISGEGTAVRLGNYVFEAYRDGVGEPLADGSRIPVDSRSGGTALVMRATTAEGHTIEREYRFYHDRYDIEASVRYEQAAFPGLHSIGWGTGPGMASTEQNVNDDHRSFRASVLLGEELHRLRPTHFGNKDEETYSGTLRWASLQTKYFTTALVPAEPVRAEVQVTGSKEGYRVSTRIILPDAAAGGRVDQSLRVYMGPLDVDRLKPLGVGLERTVEMGWKFFRPVAVAVLWSMKTVHKVIPNYGWVIVIISVLTKVLFFRLTHKSFKSMKQMQALQPRLQAIKEKYKGDQQKISQETMRLYKESGVNPLGGGLPLLLQMPVFIALFNVLKFTIEVRGEPWLAWINDLSRQDVLFRLPISLPLIGDAFSVLPILMGASMLAQSKLGGSPTGGPSSTMPAGFNTLLPIVFTVMFYKMPSGLVIYWIINTVLSVAQQWYIHREPASSAEGAEEPPPATKPKSPRPSKRRAKAKGR